MGAENGHRPDLAAEQRAADARGTVLDRIEAVLGHPVTIFTDCTAVEARLSETVELLRLWSEVREPDAAHRILAFVRTVVAEQG